MSLSYEGFGVNALTFRCSAKINDGAPVKFNKPNYVVTCSDGNEFHGVVIDSDTSYASVQMRGIVTVNYTGTAPTLGYCVLSANGASGVKVSTTGNKYLVVSVNEDLNEVTFLM